MSDSNTAVAEVAANSAVSAAADANSVANSTPAAAPAKAKKSKKAAETPVADSTKEAIIESAVEHASTYMVALTRLTEEYNPRDVFPVLTGEKGMKFMDLIAKAINPDPEVRAEYVKLVEEFEMNAAEDSGESTIPELADDIRTRGQLMAIGIRKFGTNTRVNKEGVKVKRTNYGVVFGGRRLAAVAYNHAKHGTPAKIVATILSKCQSSQDAFDMAVAENAHRRDFTDMEWGQIVHTYHKDMGLNFQEIADKIKKPYQFVRGRHALATADPKLLEKLESGEITKTHAIKTALGEKTDSKAKRKTSRQRPLTIKAMQTLFDQTDRSNHERLEALAQCMQVSVKDELDASDVRIAAAQAKEEGKTAAPAPEVDADEEETGDDE